jgi:hypothetical protein
MMIDANKFIGDKSGGLTTIFGKMGMTELIRHRHPNATEPNTHVQGSKRIDYIFGTQKIQDNCEKAGILPFGIGYQSDHRAIFIAIKNIKQILSTQVQAIDMITARKLQRAMPKEREIFIQETHRYLENNNIYQRLRQLQEGEKDGWSESDIQEYETCDQHLIHGMLTAEKRTRKLHVTSWSPTFGAAVSKKSFWKIALSLKINHTYPNKEFLNWAESLGIPDIKGMDITTIKRNYREAQKELRAVEKQAESLRETHLKSMLTAAELSGEEKKIQ